MSAAEKLITEHFDTWTSAIKAKSSAGRGSGKSREFYGLKKLRELILEIAVRGLLVPQDPDDVPASELLKMVAKERSDLVKAGKLKKQAALPPIDEASKQYPIPNGWIWAQIGTLGNIFNGDSISAQIKETKYTGVEGRPFIATKDVGYGFEGLNYENGVAIPEGAEKFQIARKGAVLICAEGGSAGRKCGITERDICFGNKLFANELFGGIPSKFILSVYLSPTFFAAFSDSMTGIIGGISKSKFETLLCPVPPLAEQHRIVAKVDELMALCDQLEQQQEDSTRTHATLVETLLGALTAAAEREVFAEAWQRIFSHFDTLFTTESSIDQLKQTVLQLAVMGELVEQNPNDESASQLLKKINIEKSRMAKGGLIKKQKPIEPITRADEPYPLPGGWQWFRLGETGIGATGKTPKTGNASSFGGEIEFIGPGQITPTGELLKSDKTLTEEGMEESTEGISGDILMVCIGGSIGKSVVANRRVAFNQQINAIRPVYILSEYLKAAVSTDGFYKAILKKSTGSATPIINRSKWEELVVPIPPLAEQHLIVAKVDELMALCDRLKARLQSTQTTQLHLADTLVEASIH